MWSQADRCLPREDRGPLRVMFANTSLPIGGAETLLLNLVRSIDRERFLPEVCCLKEPGEIGELLRREVPVHCRLLTSKYDLRVWGRLRRLLRQRHVDAVVTVGAGDKMFWGRLAAWRTRVSVVLSALHSTGWPDHIGRFNRCLTPLTDGFIAVAHAHRRYLIEHERLPASKVYMVPNGVDAARFCPNPAARQAVRRGLHLQADAPVFGIVAALRPEKNHLLFLRAAQATRRLVPHAHFLIVGDGPQREQIERAVAAAGLGDCVTLLGARTDIPDLLAALDAFVLTSHIEANPVSILEAMATGVPVIATRVGSIPETVREGETGYLVAPGDAEAVARHLSCLAAHPDVARRLGHTARETIQQHWSLAHMVRGYERLIERIYDGKSSRALSVQSPAQPAAGADEQAAHPETPRGLAPIEERAIKST
jgi:glycosyltransferase involved in cell wall biosynthesis